MNTIPSYLHWLLSLPYMINSYPLVIKISIISIITCLLIAVFFILFLCFLRETYSIKEKIKHKTSAKIERLFNKIIFENYLNSEIEIQDELIAIFKSQRFLKKNKMINGVYQIELAIEILTNIRNNNPSINQRYSLIINALGVKKYLDKKMTFSSPGTKKKALSIYSELGMAGTDSKLLSHAYSHNKEIRNEARLSYLNLSKNDPYRFFDELKEDLSEWNQIKLMNMLIEQSSNIGLPNFGKWIAYSKNKSLIIFLIKAVAYFEQYKTIDVIRTKINDSDHKLRSEAILALGKLKDTDSEEILKQIYYNQPDECQSAIIETVGIFKTGKSLEFLISAFHESATIFMKKEIANIMYNYSIEGKKEFKKLKLSIPVSELETQEVISFSNYQNNNDDLLFRHIENNLILFK